MRNSTGIVMGLAVLAAMPLSAGIKSPLSLLHRVKGEKIQKVRQKTSEIKMNISELASKFKPGVTKTYGWNGKKWVQDEEITYTYDENGNSIMEVSLDSDKDYVKTVYEYDENGKVTLKESKIARDGVNYENYKKTEFEYDPILTNVITKRTEWLWMDLGSGYDWQLVGNNYERRINRDDDGNITLVEIAVLFQGIYDPTQRLNITYGDDGKANTITEQILNYDYGSGEYYWEQGIKYTDIKWKDTDGQIYDPELLFLGNNRLQSAHYSEDEDFEAEVSVEYADDSNAYTVTMGTNMEGYPVEAVMRYTPLENDGYIAEASTSFTGFEVYSSKEELRYDDWGHMTLQYVSETEDFETYWESVVGTVEYDEKGIPTSYTVHEEYPDEETGDVLQENVFRAEYFDYVEVSAVKGMEIEVEGPAIYYNLQGVPVAHPAKGEIVVKKEGNKARKIKY